MAYRTPRHPQLERLLRVHEALQRGESINCSTLARSLEVSRKTMVRDLNYMRDRLGLPLEFDAPHNTYRYTEPVAQFPTVQISEGELFALLVARKALEQYRGTTFHEQLAASFEKLASGLRDTVSFSPTDELQAVSFKHVGLGRADAAVFNLLSRAVLRQNEVEFDYRKPGGQPERRRVQPYHLSHRENLWYLVGFDIARDALRTFAVPRISAPAETGAVFRRPTDFSPQRFFARALGVLSGDRNYRVVIRFAAAAADRVREREWHESQKLRDLPGGRLELTLQLGALAEIERWILTWGADAEALQPKELRENLRRISGALARTYR